MISDPLDPAIEAKVRESFARQSMMRLFNAHLDEVTSGTAKISATIDERVQQQQGFAHGGFVFSLADSAAGYAALTLLPMTNEVMTAELKINYLSAGKGRLIAEGRVLKPGRRLIVVAADVWAEHEGARKHIAALQGTMVPVTT
ncbi:PaaI family thioesterase [Planktotalea arctica]|uniref:PaaI family thioesterase n=1 Tax=Planktotalea arctica TaxID=1481893 RepID=UPI001FE7728D|nr:PaaI family thioesterase [Planktotalea arctica]